MNELELFAAAIAITDPGERAALLERECAVRPDLRQRIDQLLEAHFKSNPLLDRARGDHTAPRHDSGSATELARRALETEGTLIAGRYKLLQQIGEGGMGTVWMADQTEPVKRRVAVKLIHADRGSSKTILSRFEAERQAIAVMDHPNIAKLLDAGTTREGFPFFVMELVKGIPLNDYCDTNKLSIRDRLNLFTQVCSAVQHAHQKGIIHRDLKPSNILVESHDGKPVPKVIDFGLAKATGGLQLSEHTLFTAFGSVMGTPLYMAPEQASFNAVDVDTRADIYALGVILYELLTSTTPITRESFKKAALDEMLRLIREQDAPTPSSRLSTMQSAPGIAANRQMEPQKLGRFVKGELDWIVMKSLCKERERRYETATGFARDIERFLNNETVAAGPPSTRYRLRKFLRRNRGQVIAASLVLLALVSGIIGTTWGLFRANQARREEARQRDIALEERRRAEQSAAAANEQRAQAEEQRTRAEARETQAIEAVKRFHDTVAKEPVLKNSAQLEALRKRLLKEPLPFFKELRDRLQIGSDTRPESLARLAQASLDLGDLTNEIGDKKDALVAYRESLAICKKLADANPTVAEYQRRLGIDHLSIAGVLRSIGEPAAALEASESALKIFQRLADAQQASAEFRSRLALSHVIRGALKFDSGKLAESEADDRRALALYAKLVEENPGDTEFRSRLADCHRTLGRGLELAGKLAEAEAEYRKALAIRAKLADENPAVVEFQNRLAQAHHFLAMLSVATGKIAEAEAEYHKALAIQQKLADQNFSVSQFRVDLGLSHLNLGMMLETTGKPANAEAKFRQGIALFQKLAADNPSVTNFRLFLASCHFSVARVLAVTGRLANAEQECRQALEIQRKLVEDNPTVSEVTLRLAEGHDQLGVLLSTTGKPVEAENEFRHAIAISQKLVAGNSAVSQFPYVLAKCYKDLGRLLARQRRFPDAFNALETGLAIVQNVSGSNPGNPKYTKDLGLCFAYRGAARVHAGQPVEAVADLRRAIEVWAGIPHLEVGTRFEGARALALLAGLGKDAKSGVTATEAAALAERSIAALRDAMAAGWNLPEELKEPDFDAIRDRADFKKLMADLDATAPKLWEKK
jgi:serine/threonine protein kinase/tetratricopeptide (TPR) repeat protein